MRFFLFTCGEVEGESCSIRSLSEEGIAQTRSSASILKKFLEKEPPSPGQAGAMAGQAFDVLSKLMGNGLSNLNQLKKDMFKARIWHSPYMPERESSFILKNSLKDFVKDKKEDLLLYKLNSGDILYNDNIVNL